MQVLIDVLMPVPALTLQELSWDFGELCFAEGHDILTKENGKSVACEDLRV